ncbi:hypothetical protein ikelab_17410 [Lactococcus garvieae]|uniref:DUF5648 domain-containing protein n=1 Tax=Lactococcus garvieae TaxID=1363 RepID=A0A6L2ZX99_9LACT|nr:hypothetical protein [Lactococcus garvieae]GFO52466.1 hypothetical protein ikelab_17410 [Lactococcus garvieae]
MRKYFKIFLGTWLVLTLFTFLGFTKLDRVMADSPQSQPIYRLYNTRNMEHLHTADVNEKNRLPKLSKDWKYEGIAWAAPVSGDTVFRVYNPKSGEHLYTKDSYEL